MVFRKISNRDYHVKTKFSWVVGCRIKANCLLLEPGPAEGVLSLGSFYGILARIYASFGENHEKLRTARSTSSTRV